MTRRAETTEFLLHSHTKTIGDNYSFFARWNERDDIRQFRENNILRCVDDLLNPQKKEKKIYKKR